MRKLLGFVNNNCVMIVSILIILLSIFRYLDKKISYDRSLYIIAFSFIIWIIDALIKRINKLENEIKKLKEDSK